MASFHFWQQFLSSWDNLASGLRARWGGGASIFLTQSGSVAPSVLRSSPVLYGGTCWYLCPLPLLYGPFAGGRMVSRLGVRQYTFDALQAFMVSFFANGLALGIHLDPRINKCPSRTLSHVIQQWLILSHYFCPLRALSTRSVWHSSSHWGPRHLGLLEGVESSPIWRRIRRPPLGYSVIHLSFFYPLLFEYFFHPLNLLTTCGD